MTGKIDLLVNLFQELKKSALHYHKEDGTLSYRAESENLTEHFFDYFIEEAKKIAETRGESDREPPEKPLTDR